MQKSTVLNRSCRIAPVLAFTAILAACQAGQYSAPQAQEKGAILPVSSSLAASMIVDVDMDPTLPSPPDAPAAEPGPEPVSETEGDTSPVEASPEHIVEPAAFWWNAHVEMVAKGFVQPTDVATAPGDLDRLFVLEQPGRIMLLKRDNLDAPPTVFLDITEAVSRPGWEDGLLGLAFHPGFPANGLFFIAYSAGDPLRLVVARYAVNPENPDKADHATATVVLEVPKLAANHNGGSLTFGPDGYLYISVGDGDHDGNPGGTAQDPGNLLGKILRVDVNTPSALGPYSIPRENPLINQPGARPEVIALGFRNPWRMSIDTTTGRLWVADVGENRWEEINVVTPGRNYGWPLTEGTDCFGSDSCQPEGLEPPVWSYGHSDARCAVIGGGVYQGSAIPGLQGVYVYGDFCSGKLWGLQESEGAVSAQIVTSTDLRITSIRLGHAGEIYLLEFGGGLYMLQPTEAPAAGV